jgi:hypothetical protein
MAASPHRVPNIPLFEFFCKKFFDISEIKDKGGVQNIASAWSCQDLDYLDFCKWVLQIGNRCGVKPLVCPL